MRNVLMVAITPIPLTLNSTKESEGISFSVRRCEEGSLFGEDLASFQRGGRDTGGYV